MDSPEEKILIVDDSPLILELVEAALGDGFEVRRACSGPEALTVLETFPAEIVLLDIVMPGIDGYETCRRIRRDRRLMDTKVILVSARGAKAERIRGYEAGASDFIVKPFDSDELLAKVNVFLALKFAEDASRAKSEFLANMSHEIRTPMTAILGYADTLRDGALPEATRNEAIDTIWRNGQHLLEIINSVLDLSKIEASQLQVDLLPCRPAEIIVDVVSLMRERARQAGVRLTAECDGPIPERILSDRTRIKQILLNLVGNAIKFAADGSVRVTTRMRDDQAAEPMLEIAVVDTGIGLSPQQIEKLCQPFVQADPSVTRRFGGTGLGLSISRRLAVLLGGDLRIDSVEGEGSTFTVSIATGPLADVPRISRLVPPRAQRPKASNPDAGVPRIPSRILLAEDGADNQRLLDFVLRKAGAEVTIVADGQQAIDAVMRSRDTADAFDIVIMDMQMPVLDGYAATARLRQQGYQRPIMALTAHALIGDRERCLAAGCDRYASKPIDREELIWTIHDLLQEMKENRTERV